jgi:lipopolysaccharide export system protein LptC
MESPMRWLRWALASGAVLILSVLLAAYWWHQRRMERSLLPPASPGADVFENFQDVRLRDGRPVFRFQARWYRLHAESVVEGQDVRIELPSDGDRATEITARTGWWYPAENRVVLDGQVQVDWQGLRVETDRLTYRVGEAVADTETPVRWEWPARHWTGEALRARYEFASAAVTMEGQVRMTTGDGEARYRLETEAVRWDVRREIMEFLQPVRVARLDRPGWDLGCGRFRHVQEPDGTSVGSGWEACAGAFQWGDHLVKWMADDLTGWIREAERRWVLTNGQFNLDDRWWVFGRRLWLSETPGRGLAMWADERLRVEPLQASPFYGRFQFMEADRLVWPSLEALDRMQVPGPLTVYMSDGRLRARDGFYDGQRWQARAPVFERTDGWQVTAGSMVHDGTVFTLEGTAAEPVRGTGAEQGRDWHVRAQRAELLPDSTLRWSGHVEIRNPDLLLTADRWERRADAWQAEPVRRGRMWHRAGDRSYEVIFQARRAEQVGGACVRLEGDVHMEFHEPDRPGTLAVEAREGHFCEQTWRFEGDLRFRYRDLSGTAARARIEWSKEWLYADGPVDLRDARGRQAQAQAMSVDLKTERIELVNPSPRRGRLTWTETTRP